MARLAGLKNGQRGRPPTTRREWRTLTQKEDHTSAVEAVFKIERRRGRRREGAIRERERERERERGVSQRAH